MQNCNKAIYFNKSSIFFNIVFRPGTFLLVAQLKPLPAKPQNLELHIGVSLITHVTHVVTFT